MREIWKDIVEYKGFYQVSDFGRIRSFCDYHGFMSKTPRILKNIKINTGYEKVTLKSIHVNNGIRKEKLIHILVAEAFLSNHLNKKTVNHKDGIKDNNILTNLEWNTHSENVKHSFDIGIRKKPNHKGEKCPRAKMSELCAINIIILYRKKIYNQVELAKIYSVSQAAISYLILGKNWIGLDLKAA